MQPVNSAELYNITMLRVQGGNSSSQQQQQQQQSRRMNLQQQQQQQQQRPSIQRHLSGTAGARGPDARMHGPLRILQEQDPGTNTSSPPLSANTSSPPPAAISAMSPVTLQVLTFGASIWSSRLVSNTPLSLVPDPCDSSGSQMQQLYSTCYIGSVQVLNSEAPEPGGATNASTTLSIDLLNDVSVLPCALIQYQMPPPLYLRLLLTPQAAQALQATGSYSPATGSVGVGNVTWGVLPTPGRQFRYSLTIPVSMGGADMCAQGQYPDQKPGSCMVQVGVVRGRGGGAYRVELAVISHRHMGPSYISHIRDGPILH